MDRIWQVVTVTERLDGYRADVTVDHPSGFCYEQVHILDGGPESGRLLHSCRFPISHLNGAANDANRVTAYAKGMLATVMSEHKRG